MTELETTYELIDEWVGSMTDPARRDLGTLNEYLGWTREQYLNWLNTGVLPTCERCGTTACLRGPHTRD